MACSGESSVVVINMQDEVIEIVRGVAELLLYGEARGDEKMFECFGHHNTLHIFLTLVSP